MSVKIPSEITKYTTLEAQRCWHCEQTVPAGTVFLTQIYRDCEGFYTDEDDCCGFCALKNGRVFEFWSDHNQRMQDRNLDQEALEWKKKVQSDRQKYLADRSQKEANARKNARRKSNAAYTKALNTFWVDKITQAIKRVS
jgi:hypothetical protein